MCRIKTLAKVRGVSSQVGQMKQLTAQLKKNKDSAMQKVNGLEKRIVDAMSKIQVRELQFACKMHCILECCFALLPVYYLRRRGYVSHSLFVRGVAQKVVDEFSRNF